MRGDRKVNKMTHVVQKDESLVNRKRNRPPRLLPVPPGTSKHPDLSSKHEKNLQLLPSSNVGHIITIIPRFDSSRRFNKHSPLTVYNTSKLFLNNPTSGTFTSIQLKGTPLDCSLYIQDLIWEHPKFATPNPLNLRKGHTIMCNCHQITQKRQLTCTMMYQYLG